MDVWGCLYQLANCTKQCSVSPKEEFDFAFSTTFFNDDKSDPPAFISKSSPGYPWGNKQKMLLQIIYYSMKAEGTCQFTFNKSQMGKETA